ncbi:MAG: HTTM domain-containing protein [Fuerstiella sp.]
MRDFLPEPSGTVAVAMMTGLIFCLVASSIGWHTRIALAGSWGLYTYLNMLDYLSTLTKYSVISSHVLLLLLLSNCGAIWSVDRLRSRSRNDSRGENPSGGRSSRAAAWPRRLIQLFIGIVYFGAAFTKMHIVGFLSGDQIRFWLLTNMNGPKPLGEWLAMYPELIITMSHVALIWQVLFLFLCWRGRMRGVMLVVGGLFHLSTIWLLGLAIFPPIMLLTYFAWLHETDVRRIQFHFRSLVTGTNRNGFGSAAERIHALSRRLRGFAPKIPLPSALLFSLGLVASVAAGLEIEYHMDPYGHRRPAGPYALQPIPETRVSELFAKPDRMRDEDKFFALEMGTETLGGVVVHRRDTYEPGSQVIAQCALVPPHEDMWVECRLSDSYGRQLHVFGQAVTRDMLRVNFTFQLPHDLESGDYRLTIRCNSNDMLSRNIRVDSPTSVVLSN